MSTAAPEAEKRRRPLRLDLFALALLTIIALAAPALVGGLGLKGPQVHDPSALNLFGDPTGPSAGHPLGVDTQGRDVLARILYGLRSLMLLCLAATGLAVLASWVLGWLASLNTWAALALGRLLAAIRAFPPLLLGLALGLSLAPGIWRVIVPIALAQLSLLSALPALPGAVASVLPRAVAIDFGLTFLGVGTSGTSPQLGAMVARAGTSVLAGVPEWWALLFPGLVTMLVLLSARSLARAAVPAPQLLPHRLPGGRGVARLGGALVAGVLVVAIAAAAFPSLDGAGSARSDGGSALDEIGSHLAPSVSLLIGGLVVWLAATLLAVRLGTRGRRRNPVPGPRPSCRGAAVLRASPALGASLMAAAPVGWLALLALYVFSDSVGKLPVLPGPGGYEGLTHSPGHWAASLVIPWLLLGLWPTARQGPALRGLCRAAAASGQQRVARGAGVPETILGRQRRRALIAPLCDLAGSALPGFLAAALVIEVSFRIPGAGGLTEAAFLRERATTVSDVALAAALAVLALRLAADLLGGWADPRRFMG